MYQLPEGWQERFWASYERARLRELARLDAASCTLPDRYDPFAHDVTGLGALLMMVKRIRDVSHGLTIPQYLELSSALLDVEHAIRGRIGRGS